MYHGPFEKLTGADKRVMSCFLMCWDYLNLIKFFSTNEIAVVRCDHGLLKIDVIHAL